MSLHADQKNYHEVCANYLTHSAISSIDSGKGSWFEKKSSINKLPSPQEKTSLTVSLVSKRYMRGVAEMQFSSLFVQISTIAPVCLVRFGEENCEIIDVI